MGGGLLSRLLGRLGSVVAQHAGVTASRAGRCWSGD